MKESIMNNMVHAFNIQKSIFLWLVEEQERV